jgi:hypothetical protein
MAAAMEADGGAGRRRGACQSTSMATSRRRRSAVITSEAVVWASQCRLEVSSVSPAGTLAEGKLSRGRRQNPAEGEQGDGVLIQSAAEAADPGGRRR